MKKTALATMAVILAMTGCAKDTKEYDDIYKHGTTAKYNIFINDVYSGSAIYTFTHEKYKDGTDAIKIVRNSENKNANGQSVDDLVTSISEVWFDKSTFKPLFQKFRIDWGGKTAGWHETETDYGEMMAKWANRNPAGSQSKEIKFHETFYDEDTLAWIFPLLGYREGKLISFTAFSNRSGQPVQGTIWMGGTKNILVSNTTYDTFAGSARMNEVNQNVWFDIKTGRLVKYMQDAGFLGFPMDPRKVPEDWEPPKSTYVEVLDSWTDPQN